MNEKLKPGQKVLVIGSQDIDSMKEMIGKTCTIDKCSDMYKGYYFLEEDQNGFIWSGNWLEPVTEDDTPIEITEDDIFNILNVRYGV